MIRITHCQQHFPITREAISPVRNQHIVQQENIALLPRELNRFHSIGVMNLKHGLVVYQRAISEARIQIVLAALVWQGGERPWDRPRFPNLV